MSHYSAGAAFERKVRDALYANGAKLVVRSAGSKGQADLVALYGYGLKPDIVQVKTGSAKLTKAKRAELIELAVLVDAEAVLASPKKVGRKIEVEFEELT